jgi:hypothetical protein
MTAKLSAVHHLDELVQRGGTRERMGSLACRMFARGSDYDIAPRTIARGERRRHVLLDALK